MTNQAMGQARIKPMATQVAKPLFNKIITRETPAPLAFLIPISFVRLTMAYADKPDNPMQAMMMASSELPRNNPLKRCSASYCSL